MARQALLDAGTRVGGQTGGRRCTVWPSISPVAGVMLRADAAGAVNTNNGTTNMSMSVTCRHTLSMVCLPERPPERPRVVQADDRRRELLARQPVVW
jgi:hypothetical protein